MRQPKLQGFRNPNKIQYEVFNLDTLEQKLPAGSYDAAALREHKLLRTKLPAKLLSRGAVTKKFTLTVAAASKKAKEAVEKAGGSVTIA
jgi:large subunit ribosomal protein L15